MPITRQRGSRPVIALPVETSNAFSRELLHGIRDWMRAHQSWAIRLSEQGRGDHPPAWLRQWRGDGIIARIETPEIEAAVRRTRAPVVNVSASGLAPDIPAVISDSAAIAALAARELFELGLRHFGYCGDARFVWARRHGTNFVLALKQLGQTCDVLELPTPHSGGRDRERELLADWLRRLPKPAGVMACYDIRGQHVIDAARDLGLRVPDDVAVIGQHNDELLCDLCDPPLSSVIPNARRVGYEAAALLDHLMRGGRPPKRIMRIPPLGIAKRQSTDLVAVQDPRLANAVRFIRDHYTDSFSVADIARASGLSRSLLEKRYRAAFGLPPWEHVLRLRTRSAEVLLTSTNLTIAEIAERTGFGAPEYFSAAFRRHTGRPPSALRRG
jgi:LacI family transcriptional regulator